MGALDRFQVLGDFFPAHANVDNVRVDTRPGRDLKTPVVSKARSCAPHAILGASEARL